MSLANHSRSYLSVCSAVFHHRACWQKTSDDWRLPFHGTLLSWDHSVCPLPGTLSSDALLIQDSKTINLQIVALMLTYTVGLTALANLQKH